jgi:hypothetical protein
MRQHLKKYLLDGRYPGLPVIEQGELEMKAAVGVDPFTPTESSDVARGMERYLAVHRQHEADLTRQATGSLAGAGFRDRWNK